MSVVKAKIACSGDVDFARKAEQGQRWGTQTAENKVSCPDSLILVFQKHQFERHQLGSDYTRTRPLTNLKVYARETGI